MIRSSTQVTGRPPGREDTWLDDIPTPVLAAVRTMTAGEYQLRLNGSRRRACLRIGGDWLCLGTRLRTSPRDLDSKRVEKGLRRNAKIEGLPREIGAGRERYLVIDLPVDLLPAHDPAESDGLIASLLASLAKALGIAAGDPADDGTQPGSLSDERLETVFSVAEWPLRRMDAGHLAVPLEISGEFFAAELEPTGTGLRLRVPLYAEAYRAATADCRSAFCALLWLTCNRSRMVKATLASRQPRIEVSLPRGLIDDAAAAHGCAALASTLQRLAREALLLLGDERLARRYLEVIHFESAQRAVSPRCATL